MLCLLSACGGGSGGAGAGGGSVTDPGGEGPPDPPPPVSMLNALGSAERAAYEGTFLDDFAQVAAASVTGSPTVFGSQPATGAVRYTGYMQLILGNRQVSANVIGETTLQVNLASEAITGTASGFLGATTDEYDFNQVARYDGVIAISNGSMAAGAGGSYALGFEIDGVLDNGLNSFVINGNLVGTVYGDGAEGLRAIGSYTNIHGSMDVDIDGLDTPDDIAIATVSTVKE